MDLFKVIEEDLVQDGALNRESQSWIAGVLRQLPLLVSREELRERLAQKRAWYLAQLIETGGLDAQSATQKADATLAGSDKGDQIEGTLADGSAIMGVIARNGLSIEAFNQLPGQSMRSWAGFFQCAWIPALTNPNCPSSRAGWVVNGEDAPGTISTETFIDNGWGVQSPDVTVAGTSVSSWRTYFVSCLESDTSASQCVDRAAPVAKPTLPDTGADSGALAGLIGGGAALLAIGVAIVVIRRHRWLRLRHVRVAKPAHSSHRRHSWPPVPGARSAWLWYI
jgi:LPXTG-motif cell wall-anchored protein